MGQSAINHQTTYSNRRSPPSLAAAVAAVLFRYLNEQMALRSDEDSGIDDDIAEKVREDLGAEEPAKSDNS